MKKTFRSDAFVFAPTQMAERLSSVTGRPVAFKRIPKLTVGVRVGSAISI